MKTPIIVFLSCLAVGLIAASCSHKKDSCPIIEYLTDPMCN